MLVASQQGIILVKAANTASIISRHGADSRAVVPVDLAKAATMDAQITHYFMFLG